MMPLWLHRWTVTKHRNQSLRLLAALKMERLENAEELLRLQHDLDVCLDCNRSLVEASTRAGWPLP